MPGVPEDLDVFHVPHGQMKKIVHCIEDEASVRHMRINVTATAFHQKHWAMASVYFLSPINITEKPTMPPSLGRSKSCEVVTLTLCQVLAGFCAGVLSRTFCTIIALGFSYNCFILFHPPHTLSHHSPPPPFPFSPLPPPLPPPSQLTHTNFSDHDAYLSILSHLRHDFHIFKCHEEIENKYILNNLLPRLPHSAKTSLQKDIHSDNRLSLLVSLVHDGLTWEEPSEGDRVAFGKKLKDAIADFTTDFIPHMEEEEEVRMGLRGGGWD